LLVILTDQAGMCDKDPRQHPDAKLIHQTSVNAPGLEAMASGAGGSLGRGGMLTKVRAARLAGRSGSATVIAAGREERILLRLAEGEELGTLFVPDQEPIAARKQWLAGHLQVRGTLTLDAGAVRVLRDAGKSLLPVGVKGVSGTFLRGEMVSCVDEAGNEVARGLVNYSAQDSRRIQGQPSSRIEELLGYVGEPELINRDNLILR
jgi:glutamate 5-kinase